MDRYGRSRIGADLNTFLHEAIFRSTTDQAIGASATDPERSQPWRKRTEETTRRLPQQRPHTDLRKENLRYVL